MATAFHLFQLQKIDSQVLANTRRRTQIDMMLANGAEIDSAKQELIEVENILEKLCLELKALEEKILSKRNKMEQSEASLYGGGVKNPKELQDIQKEISLLRTTLSSLEEEQLSLMMKIDAAEVERQAAKQKATQAIAEFEKRSLPLLDEINTLTIRNSRLKEERSVFIVQIPPAMLEYYEKLREKKKGTAVSRITDQACEICGATLTPAECQLIKKQVKIMECPSCGRVLYAD